MRLNRYLAECGVCSRRKADELITKGEVQVNGEVVKQLGTSVHPRRDRVVVRGQQLRAQEKGIILLHKPRNVVSTLHDPEGRPAVANYLTPQYRSYFPVGRLDFETTGLIILTNDGDLAERLLHPRYQFERRYEATVEGRIPEAALQQLERGVKLEDGVARAEVLSVSDAPDATRIELIVREGRNRLIRRLFDELGHPVVALKRTAFGPFTLGTLRSGEIRRFSEREYLAIRRKVLSPGTR